MVRTVCRFAFSMAVALAAQHAQAVTIEMVPVGNPGNAADTRYNIISVGSVAKAYQIGKYEVTAGQYTDFLNAVADADPNGLYSTSMSIGFGANILRTGSSPTYSYSVAADWANRPVNYVSFWDAARFANWLHNGQPTGRRVRERPRAARITTSATKRGLDATRARNSLSPPRTSGTRRPTIIRVRAWQQVTSTIPRDRTPRRSTRCPIRGTTPISTITMALGTMVTRSAAPTIARKSAHL